MWSRRFAVGVAVIVATASATGAAFGAPRKTASTQAPAGVGHAAGTYTATLTGIGTTQLVIKSDKGISTQDGTFRFTKFADSGNWLVMGKTITLLVTAAPRSGHVGMVLIGTMTVSGIGSGLEVTPDGNSASWSATRNAPARAGGMGGATPASRRRAAVRPVAGYYTAHFSDGTFGGLDFFNSASSTHAGQWTYATANSFESGNWVSLGKQVAMGTISGAASGETFLGPVTSSGIGDQGKPAEVSRPTQGIEQWHAIENVVCNSTYTVDAKHGNDTHSGSCTAPFKTLSKALSVATSLQSIEVNPGTYDAANGETFPLVVQPGVVVIGDDASRGTSPLTQVTGEIDLSGEGGTIEGLNVVGVIDMTAADTAVRDSTITTGGSGTLSGICIHMLDATGSVVTSDVITGCTIGVLINGSDSSPQFRNDSVTGNGDGVEANLGTADLGTSGSAGGNLLSCNSNADLLASVSVSADGDIWDHVPPTLSHSFPGSGIDIYEAPGATVTDTSPTAASSACL